jgi:hypothetical protein
LRKRLLPEQAPGRSIATAIVPPFQIFLKRSSNSRQAYQSERHVPTDMLYHTTVIHNQAWRIGKYMTSEIRLPRLPSAFINHMTGSRQLQLSDPFKCNGLYTDHRAPQHKHTMFTPADYSLHNKQIQRRSGPTRLDF